MNKTKLVKPTDAELTLFSAAPDELGMPYVLLGGYVYADDLKAYRDGLTVTSEGES